MRLRNIIPGLLTPFILTLALGCGTQPTPLVGNWTEVDGASSALWGQRLKLTFNEDGTYTTDSMVAASKGSRRQRPAMASLEVKGKYEATDQAVTLTPTTATVAGDLTPDQKSGVEKAAQSELNKPQRWAVQWTEQTDFSLNFGSAKMDFQKTASKQNGPI